MLLRLESDISLNSADAVELKHALQRNILKIEHVLTGDLHYYSPHARLLPGSMIVSNVEKQTENCFKMLYQFDCHIFSPCLDLDETFSLHQQSIFRLLPGFIEFEVIDTTPPSPSDEL